VFLECISKKQFTLEMLTISEAANSVQHWHLDDECKQIIDESVECLVSQHAPWQVSNRLQLVVDEQLWRHCNEPCTHIRILE